MVLGGDPEFCWLFALKKTNRSGGSFAIVLVPSLKNFCFSNALLYCH